jgi:hypothetical protein
MLFIFKLLFWKIEMLLLKKNDELLDLSSLPVYLKERVEKKKRNKGKFSCLHSKQSNDLMLNASFYLFRISNISI